MPLTMRPTGMASGVDKDRQDWTMFDDGEPVGRIYEVSASTPAELRWFWSIVISAPPTAGIVISGKAPTIEAAKAALEASWRRCQGGKGALKYAKTAYFN
jgi:hypothetical protein